MQSHLFEPLGVLSEGGHFIVEEGNGKFVNDTNLM